jgi:hypothetical protein
VSHQTDSEDVWDELVGDAFTPSGPLPPPPEFAGAIDEEMQARPSARLPLHVVPMSGPDSDAVPIESAGLQAPSLRTPVKPATPVRRPVVRRPQTEADAVAAPQTEVAMDGVVEVEVGRRRVSTLRTGTVRPQDDLDVVLFEVAQTGPHATVAAGLRAEAVDVEAGFGAFADDVVELDIADLDVDDDLPGDDGRAVVELELAEADDIVGPMGPEEDNVVAGEIDLSGPVAAPRGGDPTRALVRSAAIAHAMRGATVRVPLVPERKVKTAIGSVSSSRPPRGSLHPAKANTIRTGVIVSAVSSSDAAVPPRKPITVKTAAVAPSAGPVKRTTLRTVAVAAKVVEPAAVPVAVVDAPAMRLSAGPCAPAGPSVTPAPARSGVHSAGSSVSLRRIVIGQSVVTTPRSKLAWVGGAAAVALAALLVAVLRGDDAAAPEPVADAPAVVAVDEPSRPTSSHPSVAEEGSPTQSGASAEPAAERVQPQVDPATPSAEEEARNAAGQAYVAAAARYEAEHSNDALEAMVEAACEMDDGPRARTAYRKLRGADPRSRAMLFCRPLGIDLWARGNGFTASEMLRVAQRQLAAGDTAEALESARESNRLGRSNEALVVMGIALCKLGRVGEIAELQRHLPASALTDVETACAGA